jgi:hypothetical protein
MSNQCKLTKEERTVKQKELHKQRSDRILEKKKQEKLNDDRQYTITVSGTTMSIHPAEGTQQGTIIFLHGAGDSASGSLEFGKKLFRKLPFMKIVLMTAPSRPITLYNGSVMTAWHDFETTKYQDMKFNGLQESKDTGKST